MKDLKLPVFKTPDIPAKKMTMTAYAKFVLDGLKSLKNKDRALEIRLKHTVPVRFSLD